MDPLSLAANVIAVASATQSALHGIQTLAGVQKVPEQVLQLQNEVLRLILSSKNAYTNFLGI